MVGICRLCASCRKDEQLKIIKDTNDSICHKLQKCCNIFIRNDDLLPKCVCQDCVTALEQAFEFYSRVHDAQEALTVTFLATTKMQNDNMAGKSNPTQTKTFVQDLQTVTTETIEYANVPSVEREPVNVKEENFCDYQLQNATATTYEDSFAIEQDYKVHVSDNLLMENAIDERSQSIDNIMDDFRKRNILRAWEPSLTTDNNDGFQNTSTPPKRFKETTCNSTEEIFGIIKTVLMDQKKLESRVNNLEKIIGENVLDHSVNMSLLQTANFSKFSMEKDTNSKIQVEIANLLPLTTIDKIDNLEEKLENKIYTEEMIRYLYRIKGVTGELDGIFRRIFSDDVLNLFNWDGRFSKKALQKLKLVNDVLFDVFKDEGRIQFEKDIRRCIELSHNRIKQKMYNRKRNSIELAFKSDL